MLRVYAAYIFSRFVCRYICIRIYTHARTQSSSLSEGYLEYTIKMSVSITSFPNNLTIV